jgi:hypothetical protein
VAKFTPRVRRYRADYLHSALRAFASLRYLLLNVGRCSPVRFFSVCQQYVVSAQNSKMYMVNLTERVRAFILFLTFFMLFRKMDRSF